MKKQLSVIALVLAMLAMFTGTAAAAPLASGSVTLVSVIFVAGKGPVFTFQVSGHYSKQDLKGAAVHVVGGEDFSLYCVQVDSDTVTCTVSKAAADHDIVVTWGGATFTAHTPADPHLNCYGIWDWTINEDAWMYYGRHCQRDAATFGNVIVWNNPVWGPSPYVFAPGSPSCFTNDVSGDGYYYPGCPNAQ